MATCEAKRSGQAPQAHSSGSEAIAALATPPGGAIGVLRLSGEGSLEIFSRMTGISAPEHAKMRRCAAVDEHGEALDDAMAVFFFAPHSYTGEDAAEVHLHGSAAVMRRALAAAVALGARVAEPGEFTRRAFLAGKMKLSEAEAVMDEIVSETDRGAKTALLQLRGALTRRVGEVEDALTEALAAIDAAIDYPDELEDDVESALPATISAAKEALDALISEGEGGRAVREGARVVLMGAPNAGKSTLLNALAGEERAIVTAEAGTTRDILRAHTVIDGVSVTLVDTAGLRDATSEPERIGVERAQAAARTADLVLWLVGPDAPRADDTGGVPRADAPTPRRAGALLPPSSGGNAPAAPRRAGALLPPQNSAAPVITVYTKSDIAPAPGGVPRADAPTPDDAPRADAPTPRRAGALLPPSPGGNAPAAPTSIRISALTGENLPALRTAIASALKFDATAEYPAVTNVRHIAALKAARAALETPTAPDLDSTATDIRTALVALGAISGKDVDERVIAEIFNKFCVGK